MQHPLSLALFLALSPAAFTAAPIAAQQAPEGYADQVRPLPAGTTQILTLPGPGGGEVFFDGTALVLRGLGAQRPLLTFAAPVFGSFLVEAGSAQVLFGESSTGGIWRVALTGPPPQQPIATIAFNYDAAMWSPNQAIVSAKTGGFGAPDNELLLLDVVTGASRQLAVLPGASGPVAVDGALFYATAPQAWPTPPGQVAILHFDRATVLQAIGTNQVLGPGHARIVVSGLDAASDLAIDNDGDLFFVDWFLNVVGEVDDIAGPFPHRKDLLTYAAAAVYPGALQFVPGGPGPFEPFARPGGALCVLETDYGALSQLHVVVPRGADLTSSVANPVPGGPFTLRIGNGPHGGAGLIAIGLPAAPHELVLAVPGFEQPLLWQSSLVQPVNTHFVTFDAMGGAALTLSNPGFHPIQGVLSQAAFVDAGMAVLGATPPLVLRLSQ